MRGSVFFSTRDGTDDDQPRGLWWHSSHWEALDYAPYFLAILSSPRLPLVCWAWDRFVVGRLFGASLR
jgi:hypothetical protein